LRAYEAGTSVRNIQRKLRDEANVYLFKDIKNFLGTKDYIKRLKEFRVPIMNSIFTADLVQMERNTPEGERVFTRFVRKLTSKADVQTAVDQNLLPASALNIIDKGTAVSLYEKANPTEAQFMSYFDIPTINPKTGARSGTRGTRKDQLAKNMAGALSYDATMEVAQEQDVIEKRQQLAEIKNETIDVSDIQNLAVAIGRDPSVKFSLSSEQIAENLQDKIEELVNKANQDKFYFNKIITVERDKNGKAISYKLNIPLERNKSMPGPRQHSKENKEAVARIVYKYITNNEYGSIVDDKKLQSQILREIILDNKSGKTTNAGIAHENIIKKQLQKTASLIKNSILQVVSGGKLGDIYLSLGNIKVGIETKLQKARSISQSLTFLNDSLDINFPNKNTTTNSKGGLFDDIIGEQAITEYKKFQKELRAAGFGEVKNFTLNESQANWLKNYGRSEFLIEIEVPVEYLSTGYASGKYKNAPQGFIIIGRNIYRMVTGNQDVDNLTKAIVAQSGLNIQDLKLTEGKKIKLVGEFMSDIGKNKKVNFRIAGRINSIDYVDSNVDITSEQTNKKFVNAIENVLNKESALKLSKSAMFSRSTNNPTKGITVLDFDDTLATSKSLIRFTRPGEKLLYNASPKSLKDLGARSGVIYLATDKKEADAYAESNRGDVKEFVVNESSIANEAAVLREMKEQGIDTSEGLLYELIDSRFEDYFIGKKNVDKVFNALRKKGVKAFKYKDGSQVSSGSVESVAVIDKSALNERGTLNAEQYASTYENLSELGYKFDFSEFTKVVDGKTAPLFNKAMKLQGKFGPENMFVLTARPMESAGAIHAFLKANGLNIPLKNITGLANSTAEAKALWMAEKVGEGYNDFYFADDALQNVKAVKNMLNQLDVKSKVQQAVPSIIKQKVKFSKSSLKNTINSPQYKKFRNNIKDRVLYHGGSETINTIRNNNAVWFYLDDIEAAQMWGDGEVYSVKMEDLQDMVVLPDLNDVDMFTKHIQEKFNLKDDAYDIRDILKHPKADEILTEWVDWSSKNDMTYDVGYNLYEKGNVTNGAAVTVLGVIPKNKIQQVSPKFSKSSLRDNKAVKNILDQFDVKSKVQQARVKFSRSMDEKFNDILENVTNIESKKRFSAIKGRKRGDDKGKFRFFIPPSHEDFVGLLYNFMGKGKEGNAHRDFFETALVRPLNRAYREIDTAKQAIANDYKNLAKRFPKAAKALIKKTPDGDFTFEDAVRVYLWNKHGYKIPGLSETDQQKLVELVSSMPGLRSYAENINIISKQEKYVDPGQSWETGNIRIDLVDATGRVGRAQYFTEFNENAEVLFSTENLNKIEAAYGKGFREALEDMLHRIKTGVNRPKGSSGKPNMFMNWLNASVSGVMFFNTRSALLQQLSNVNFLNFADNNILAAGKAFANQKQYWADFAMIFNSDMLKQRRGGIGTDINGAELAEAIKKARPDSMFDQVSIIVGKALKLGFLPTQIGDNIAIATGGAAFYRNRVNKLMKNGMSRKVAEAAAFTDLQNITQSTQQSARPDMTSQQQASWIGKLVLNFLNTPSQYNRIIKKAGSDIINRRITPPNENQMQSDMSNMSRVLYYGAAQNLIFYSLQTALFAVMFGTDDEDDDKRAEQFLKKKERVINGTIDTLLRGSGIYGVAVSTLKNMTIKFLEQRDKGYNKDESAVIMEMLNFSPVVGIKVRKIVNAEKTLNYNKKVIDEMETFDIDNPQWSAVTNYVEAITTAPTNRIYQKTINLRNAADNDYTALQRALFFSGYTTWSLDLGDTQKMKDIKEGIKSKKKSNKKKNTLRDFYLKK